MVWAGIEADAGATRSLEGDRSALGFHWISRDGKSYLCR